MTLNNRTRGRLIGAGWLKRERILTYQGNGLYHLFYLQDVKLTRPSVFFLKQGGTQANLLGGAFLFSETGDPYTQEMEVTLAFTTLTSKEMEQLPIRAKRMVLLHTALPGNKKPSFSELFEIGQFNQDEVWA